ncbi:MAG: tetratricopeptide repeat protein [Ignavibacteria bacterium]|nr:tetratricopeptide repeat protein [Ignavibacteria bacterium]
MRAISLYKYSLEIHPYSRTYTYLGWAYSADGDYERAVEECKCAVALDPEQGSPYNDIGAYMTRMGKYEEARIGSTARSKPHAISQIFTHLNLRASHTTSRQVV